MPPTAAPDDVAALLARLGPRATASHATAARLHGLALVEPGLDAVTVPAQRGRARVPAGWRVRRHDLLPAEVELREGLRCTTPVRTLLDLASCLPVGEAVAVADDALHRGLVLEDELRPVLAGRRGRGAAGPRAVARLLDGRAESVLESLLRVCLASPGLPAPEVQHVVLDARGCFVARVDLCWPRARLVVEADGFAFHSDRAAYRRDRERLNALERLGWRVLRFTWEDVRARPDHVLAVVRDCLALAA